MSAPSFILVVALLSPVWLEAQGPAVVRHRLRIVDNGGQPLPEACARLGPMPTGGFTADELLGEQALQADENGVLSWEAALGDSVWVAARGRVPVQVQSNGAVAWGGTCDLGAVALAKGAALIGRVRTAGGGAVAGAKAALHPLTRSWGGVLTVRPHLRGTTDTRGFLRIPAVPVGAGRLTLDHAEHVTMELPFVSPFTPLDVTMDPGVVVAGRVEGVEVGVALSIGARTEDGELHGVRVVGSVPFSFRVPAGLRYRIYSSDRSGTLTPSGGVRSGPVDDLVIARKAPEAEVAALRVRAVGPDGKAVTEFAVRGIWQMTHGMHRGHYYTWFDGTPAEDGVATAVIDSPWNSGSGVLRIRAEGFGETFLNVDAPNPGATPRPVTATLEREIVAVGKVVDGGTGAGVAGAEVWAIPCKANSSIGYGTKPDIAVTTAADGTYRLPQLSPSRWSLQVCAAGRVTPKSIDLDLTQHEGREVGVDDVALVAQLPVAVQVDAPRDGRPWRLVHEVPSSGGGGWSNFGGGVLDMWRPLTAFSQRSPWQVADASFTATVETVARGSQPYALRSAPLEVQLVDGELTVDASAVRVCELGGRWTAGDTAFAERLEIRAQQGGDNPRHGSPQVKAAVIAGRDGTYSMEIMPGSYSFAVVDLATQLEVWRSDGVIDIEAAQGTLDLNVEVAAVRVRLVPQGEGPGVRPAAQQITIQPDGVQSGRRGWTICTLPIGLETVLLPRGPVTFDVQRRAVDVLSNLNGYAVESVGGSSWEPGMEEVVLRIPAPFSDAELGRGIR